MRRLVACRPLGVVLLLLTTHYAHAMWWFVSQLRASLAAPRVHCENIPGLVRRQRLLCERHPDVMLAVAEGAALGLRHCQRQFLNAPWNCSVIDRDASVFGKHVLRTGTRETAFVYAISSAGVVHATTRACSRGALNNCYCDPNKQGRHGHGSSSFTWGGCSDNIRYGTAFARRFVDAREKKQRDARALMNLHNNRAGRKAAQKRMRLECKCHGVSGSCSARTCWRAVAPFGTAARWLKRRYDDAVLVGMSPHGRRLRPQKGRREMPVRTDLVYLEPSPDYCSSQTVSGFPGTAGRQCNETSKGSDGCDRLCCGRGYVTQRHLVSTKCGCKFQWCCMVECKTCKVWKDFHYCKAMQ